MENDGNISQLLVGVSLEEKADIKARELAKIILDDHFELIGNDGRLYSIEVIEQPSFVNGLLSISVKASINGQEVFVDNPLLYHNPPILIESGTYTKVRDELTGIDTFKPDFIENPEQALKVIIVDTIRSIHP